MKKSIIFILLILFSVTSVFSYEFDSDVYQAQKLFKSLGYDIGKIDGKLGPKTSQMIRRFQMENGLYVTGNLTNETLRMIDKLVSWLV